jgi:hypothetical protein
VFAAVHFAVALPIIASLEADDAAMWRDHNSHSTRSTDIPPSTATVSERVTEDAVSLDLCHMTDQYSPSEDIVIMANLPAAFITEWRGACPPSWSISGMLIATAWEPLNPALLAKRRTVDLIFLSLIATQWLVVGSLPLRPRRKLSREPATLITLFTALAAVLSLIPQIGSLSRLLAFFAAISWLWWFALLVWKLLLRARTWAIRRRPGLVQS